MKVGVIGCGGIGSYFAQHMDKLIDLQQIPSHLEFDFYDDDIVEPKNLLYQNFLPEDTDSNKTDALQMRFFNLNFITRRVGMDDLTQYGLIILCADNNKIRKETYANWNLHGMPFIDSRANGRCIGLFSNETENYLNTIDDSEEPTSCQNPFQIKKKEIEFGNVVVASMLAQAVLTYFRKNKLPTDTLLNL